MAAVADGAAAAAAGSDRLELVPLEANPDVMTELVRRLGLGSQLGLHDVYSLTEPELLAMVPRPAVALLLVFPLTVAYEAHRLSEDGLRPPYDGCGPTEPVVWFRQTVSNMCGMVALLHAALNGAPRDAINSDSTLAQLLCSAEPLGPTERAKLLEQPALVTAHAQAAAGGDTPAPASGDDQELHYVCFVRGPTDGHLWELDGRRSGPLDRGPLEPGGDVLSDDALALGPLAFLRRDGHDLRFSCLALGPADS